MQENQKLLIMKNTMVIASRIEKGSQKFKTLLILVLLFLVNGFIAESQQTTTLQSGTMVRVQLVGEISSDHLTPVDAITDQDIKDPAGNVLIERGTPVEIFIVRNESGFAGRSGSISIEAEQTTAVDNQTIRLTGTYFKEGKNRKTLTWVLTGAGCLVIFPLNFLFLLINGQEATLPPNYRIPGIKVASTYNIKIPREKPGND